MSLSDYSLLDKALYRLSRSGALLKNGFVNHAPMAAEALVAMGKAEEAEAWVGRQLAHLMPERESQRDLRDFDWQANLGDLSTDAAWRGLFAKELEVADWRPVLDCWSRRLAPGLSAAATHGIIRVGHAARALGVDAFRVKMGAIMLSGFFAGLAGVFYAQYFLYLDPHIAYGAAISVESLLVPIIGGMGTLFGPLLGAAFLHGLSELSRAVIGDAPGISLVLYGVLLVIMVLFVPRGLAGLASHLCSGKPAQPQSEEGKGHA